MKVKLWICDIQAVSNVKNSIACSCEIWKSERNTGLYGIHRSGAPNDGFLRHGLKSLLRLSRVWQNTSRYLEMYLSGALKFVSVRSSSGNLWLFEVTRLQCYFSKNFRYNRMFYETESFSYSSLHHIFKFENFSFPFSMKISLIKRCKILVKCEKINFSKGKFI